MNPTSRHVFAALAVIAVTCLSAIHPARAIVPEYRVGETARVYVVAPFPISVIDPDKTAELKLRDAQRIPPVFRWNTNASAEAVAAMRAVLATNRARFIAALRAEYQQPKLDDRSLNAQAFRNFVVSFRAANPDIPMPLPLARLWAKDDDGSSFLAPREELVALTAALWIRPEQLSAEAKTGGQPKLVATDAKSGLTAALVDKGMLFTRRTNTVALSRARNEMMKELSGEDKALSRLLTSFIQPNCTPEDAITRELRDRRVKDVWSVANFNRGHIIVRAGEVVTPVAKAALDELLKRTAAAGPKIPPKPEPPEPFWQWIIGGAIATTLLILLWRLKRRPSPTNLALAVPTPPGSDLTVRAQVAERLARFLGEGLVQRLYGDRKRLMAAQSAVTKQTQQIEQRIENIQSNVQERFQAYEKRIAELERELADAEEQNRDLIRAKITLAKQELESERAYNRLGWN